ncbi:hypothetical protein TDB9533_01614 [Thalassocella blandensis]|nr:hypothetical protein TDB9533_01614 [Thalassocella blandensis]
MESLYLLIPLAIVIVAIAVGVFFWAVKSGQFDDLDTEAKRILFDNDSVKKKSGKPSPENTSREKNITDNGPTE